MQENQTENTEVFVEQPQEPSSIHIYITKGEEESEKQIKEVKESDIDFIVEFIETPNDDETLSSLGLNKVPTLVVKKGEAFVCSVSGFIEAGRIKSLKLYA